MSYFTNEAAATGDESLAEIRKSAEATRRPGETPEIAFTRYLETHPGLVAEMGRQAALAKRRAAGPLASLPDPAFDKLMAVAKRMVDAGGAPSVEQAFAKLWEGRDPDVRRLVKAAKARSATALGAADEATDDDDDAVVADPIDGGSITAAVNQDTGGDLDPNAGGVGATGGARSCGRAKMFSDIMPAARPVARATTEGSYNPALRPPSATRAAPSFATSRSYARPDPQAIGKRTAVRKVDEDRLVKRGKRLIDRGFSVSEALYIASAPGKAARRRLAKRIAAQKARAA